MSCDDNVCGTGSWTGPKPGDPDNNVTLHANQVYGGINVSWSYPLTNANAVAHTILYRGVVNDLSKAIQLGYIGGSIYYDRLDPTNDTTYFYWIKIVSVNGTIGDPVGPASAIARPQVQQTLESLTGMIDAGKLAQDLKTDISGLTSTNTALYQEIMDRLNANAGFAAALSDVQNGLKSAMTYVTNETTARTDGVNAVVQQVNIIAAANKTALAAIDDEKSVRVGQNDATAKRIDSMLVTVGANTAAIQTESTTRATADGALSTRVDSVAASAANAAAAVRDETTARVSADSALSSRITTAESTLNGNTATGQVGLVTTVNQVNGLVTSISAEYFAKVEVNGLIGGFGILNNGKLVEAGFDVDRFWIGRTGPDKVKPFIIDNGVVYMDKAIIRSADIDTLKIAGQAVTGLTAATSSGSVPASGSTTIAYASQYMPPGSSGAVVSASASLYCANDASVTMTIYKNGSALGSTGVSLRGGYHGTAAYTALDYNPAGSNTYSLGFSNPDASIPGGGQGVSVDTCALIVSGAKR